MPEIIELSNGLKIITEFMPEVRSATVGVMVRAGSAFETQNNNGISHFVEHLIFRGTKTRSAQVIAQSIEGYGGSLNAYTEKEMTYYYARVLSEQVILTVDIFCDMLLNSLFDSEDIEIERQVIIEEIKMYEDSPEDIIYDILLESAWGDNPLTMPVTGTINTVKCMGKASILALVKNFYVPSNVIFTLSGNFDCDKVLNTIKKHFNILKSSAVNPDYPLPIRKPSVVIREKDVEQVYLCVTTRGIEFTDDQRFSLMVIDTALFGGISSRLFRELRENRGLVYFVSSHQASFKKAGLFGIYAGTNPSNAKLVIEVILNELLKVKEYGLTKEELLRAKKQLKGSFLLGLESTQYRALRNANSVLYFDKIHSVDEISTLIDNIADDDILKLSDYMFNKDYYTLSLVWPKDNSYNYLLDWWQQAVIT